MPAELPQYEEVLVWYNDLAAETQATIRSYPWNEALGISDIELTSRAKTIDTLREKLLRDHATPLASIQDIAGVRFEAEMSLDDQDGVGRAIARLFDHDFEHCRHDIRGDAHSGYRALHLWLRLEGGRVEVQIRTHLQGAWANAYESAADVLGRDIRYDHLPPDEQDAQVVVALRDLSTGRIAQMEHARNSAERIKREYASLLRELPNFGEEDTLPTSIVSAQEAAVRIDELQTQVRADELAIQGALQSLKGMFDNMERRR